MEPVHRAGPPEAADRPGRGRSAPRPGPPLNELPAVLPLELELARNDDVAVSLSAALVYSTGLELTVRAVGRGTDVSLGGEFPSRRDIERRTPFLIGAEYTDGRRASTVPTDFPPPPRTVESDPNRLRLSISGGIGSGGGVSSASFFLGPLPEEGDITLVTAWPKHHLDERRSTIREDDWRRARDRVVTLWPEVLRTEQFPSRNPLPEVPPDGWFAQFLA